MRERKKINRCLLVLVLDSLAFPNIGRHWAIHPYRAMPMRILRTNIALAESDLERRHLLLWPPIRCVESPLMFARFIRFDLLVLAYMSAHHHFENLCRDFAKFRRVSFWRILKHEKNHCYRHNCVACGMKETITVRIRSAPPLTEQKETAQISKGCRRIYKRPTTRERAARVFWEITVYSNTFYSVWCDCVSSTSTDASVLFVCYLFSSLSPVLLLFFFVWAVLAARVCVCECVRVCVLQETKCSPVFTLRAAWI